MNRTDRRRPDLSPSATLRKATGMAVAILRHFGDPRDEIRRKILDAAKSAPKPGPGRREDVLLKHPDGTIRHEEMTDLDGIFRIVAVARWQPMDDRKAERFYEVVEDCIDHWLAVPDLSGAVDIPPMREALGRLDEADVAGDDLAVPDRAALDSLRSAIVATLERLADVGRICGLTGRELADDVTGSVRGILRGVKGWTYAIPRTIDEATRDAIREAASRHGMEPDIHLAKAEALVGFRLAIQDHIGSRPPSGAEMGFIMAAIGEFAFNLICH